MPTYRQQHGLTLTETLTALVLLAIGVLCIATIYLERTAAAPAVLLHSKANRLAQEMAERMRAHNSEQVHFENPVGVRCEPRLATTSPKATPQLLVTTDIACWQEKVAQTLPNGSGAITHDTQQPTPAYLITVSWSPPKRGTASFLLRVAMPVPMPVAMPVAISSAAAKSAPPAITSTPVARADATRAAN